MIIVICEHCLFKIIIKEISNCTIDFLFLMFFFAIIFSCVKILFFPLCLDYSLTSYYKVQQSK